MIGAVMMDLHGPSITDRERMLLAQPVVGGVILFSRHYENKAQLRALVAALKAIPKASPLLVAVDHEGGRVQRFRKGFTEIIAMGQIGAWYEHDPASALTLAHDAGFVMADELLQVGIDFSFAPVLDLAYGTSEVIGDRSFSANPETVTVLARAFISGMREAGMRNVGKHFPGHGFVAGDSHHELPVDNRDFATISQRCLLPFATLIQEQQLDAIMPAHIIYPAIDKNPAGFSEIWLQQILRQQLGFQGVIVSDDLSMAGAEFAGTYSERASLALAAGCDLILVCNHTQAAETVIEHLNTVPQAQANPRLQTLYGVSNATLPESTRSLYQQRYIQLEATVNKHFCSKTRQKRREKRVIASVAKQSTFLTQYLSKKGN